ncbi:ParB N-terminal domain-containing protein [Romboutsia sp.]|uniref:ParB N-terminal domain-containing protein n=1 Tax=Romboutsia sp. TaxID=1965302 RepID=UPI002C137E1B|nr:ParB N-terminal domain-containing protein [Romboutsia sp.]HSQ87996.1 ParB N-terminal domain-containing protein [Romboutsia sp.]
MNFVNDMDKEKQLIGMVNDYIRKNNLGDEVVAFIKKTSELDKFSSKLEGIENRQLSSVNLRDLTKSMSKKQLMIPANVTPKGELIDGNHRLAVAKKLGLPYYYYISEDGTLDDRIGTNANMRRWDANNYLQEHIERKNEEYIWLKKLCNRCNMTIDGLLLVISKISETQLPIIKEEFKNGTLKIEKRDFIEMFINDLTDFAFFKEYKSSRFVSAFLDLYMYPRYNHDTMLTSIEKYGKDLVSQRTTREYLSVLSKIYSKCTKSKIKYSIEFNTFL